MAEKLKLDLGYSHGAQSFLLALASPLLDSFANDDNVPDNKGVLKGYARISSADSFINIAGELDFSFAKLMETLKTILTYVFKGIEYIKG